VERYSNHAIYLENSKTKVDGYSTEDSNIRH